MTVTAIIVTYNRQKDLLRCINAVLKQTKRPDNLLIINNASTDDTIGMINQMFGDFEEVCHFEQDVISKTKQINSIPIYLVNKSVNTGGAGGFYIGLKIAHQYLSTDYYWMMDDDGYPSEDCLKQQLIYSEKYDYVMPVSIDIDNHLQLSWPTKKKDNVKTSLYQDLKDSWGVFMPFVFPFNGCLFSANLVQKVGYIKPELFIWGDDYEHYYRCLKRGFHPITLLEAVFYHPANKTQTYPMIWGLCRIPFVSSKLRFVCLVRNWTYIYKQNRMYFHIVRNFLAYSWFFIITRKMDLTYYKLYVTSLFDGLFERWNRHSKYI